MQRLAPADLFRLRYVHDARFSPDGGHVAYTVSSSSQGEERYEIWVERRDDGSHSKLPYPGNAKSPRWSRDGQYIAFLGDDRLHVAHFSSLAISEPLSPEHLTVQGAPSWAPDGTRIAVCLLRHSRLEGPRRITSAHYRSDAIGFLDDLSQAIHVIGRITGEVRCLTDGRAMAKDPEWSPCGRHILFIELKAGVPALTYPPRLRTIDVASERVTEVLGDQWYVTCARWLADGERIAVTAARKGPDVIPTLSLWVVDRLGREAIPRAPDLPGSVGMYVEHDMPIWEHMFGANSIAVADDRGAYVSIQHGGDVEIWRVALDGPVEVECVVAGPRTCIVLDAHERAGGLLYAVTDLTSPTELYYFTLESREERRITRLNDEVLRQWPRVSVDRFSFGSPDGLDIDAWFFSRAGRPGALPTILYIHGGPQDTIGNAFRYDFHLLASHGFGVLFANFRGSMGYGAAFMRAIGDDWGTRAYPDHIGAVEAAVARGFADPARLGVWGYSHGGFATSWIVGHTDRFKAAVSENGVANFTTAYYGGDIPEVIAALFGGRPHEIPDVYRSRSPITYAPRCKTPTLILHGEADFRCPIAGAEEFYRALRDAGCPTELVIIPGCSHNGAAMGPLSARLTQNEALLDWFERYLLSPPGTPVQASHDST